MLDIARKDSKDFFWNISKNSNEFLNNYRIICTVIPVWTYALISHVHPPKRHRLDEIDGFYQPDAICQQVVSSLYWPHQVTSSRWASDLLQLDICRLAASWWNSLHQACMQFATCSKSVDNLEQTCYHQAGASDANASWYRRGDSRLAGTCPSLAMYYVTFYLQFSSCNTIALGNGKGCRETEGSITRMKKAGKLKNDVVYRYNNMQAMKCFMNYKKVRREELSL